MLPGGKAVFASAGGDTIEWHSPVNSNLSLTMHTLILNYESHNKKSNERYKGNWW